MGAEGNGWSRMHGGDQDGGDQGKILPRYSSWRDELPALQRLARPIVLTSALSYGLGVTDMVLVGQMLGAEDVAVVGLANSLYNVAYSFLMGVATAQDTLSSQSFGAGNHAAGLAWGFTSLVVLSGLGLVCAVVLWYSDVMAFSIMQQTEDASQRVALFCRLLILSLPPLVWSRPLQKALQARNIVRPPLIMGSIAFFFNALLSYSLIKSFGLAGAPIATSISRWLQLFMVAGYWWWNRDSLLLPPPPPTQPQSPPSSSSSPSSTSWKRGDIELDGAVEAVGEARGEDAEEKQEETPNGREEASQKNAQDAGRGGPNHEDGVVGEGNREKTARLFELRCSLRSNSSGSGRNCSINKILRAAMAASVTKASLATFLSLGVAGGVMLSLEHLSFELLTVFAGILSTDKLDAHLALVTVVSFNEACVPFGMSVAATIHIGNLLGRGEPQRARNASMVVVSITFLYMLVCSMLLMAFRDDVGELIVSDDRVLELVSRIVPLGALNQLVEAIQAATTGVLRAMGAQSFVLFANLGGFWLVGVSLAAYLAFGVGLSLQGLWVGLCAGVTVTAIVMSLKLCRADWEEESRRAIRNACQIESSESESEEKSVPDEKVAADDARGGTEEEVREESTRAAARNDTDLL